MEQVGEILARGWQVYIDAAVGPLHKLSWQTASLFLILVLSAALIAYWIARASWRLSQPSFEDVRIKSAPHTYRDHLRVSARDYMKFHKRGPETRVDSDVVTRDVAKDATRFYVVTVVEKGKLTPIISREMHLQFTTSRRYHVQDKLVQFDSTSLTDIRLGNTSDDDDEAGSDIAGTYNIYVRPVRWYDVRHWLTHPNREIRLVIWVTIITTMLPMLMDFLFG